MEPRPIPWPIEQDARWIEELSKNLGLLEKDLNLKAKGYRLRYAIDFSEIFAYAYPLALVSARRLPNESPEAAFARRNFAELFLFHDFQGSLLLLPPYVVELRDHLIMVRRWASLLHEQLELVEKIEARLLTATQPSLIQDILERANSGSQLTGRDRRVLAEYAKENYKELWVSLTCGVTEGSPRIRELFQDGGVQTIDRFYPRFTIRPDEVKESVDTWLQRINKLRPYRDHANYLDAIACAYLVKINEILNKNGEVLLFITRSSTMQDVLNDPQTSSLNIGGERLDIARDVSCLITDLVHRQGSDAETVRAIQRARNRAQEFLASFEELRSRQELQSPSADEREAVLREEGLAGRLKELAGELRSSSISYENLQLVVQTKENLKSLLKTSVQVSRRQTTETAEVSRKVLGLLVGDATVLERIRTDANSIEENIVGITSELRKLIDFDSIALQQIQRILEEASGHQLVAQVPALTEIPFRVRFPTADLKQVAQEAYERASQGEIKEAFRILMRSLAKDTAPERYLAWCDMQMRLGSWALAADIAQRGITDCREMGKTPYEFLVIRAICLGNLRFQTTEHARSTVEQALSTCVEAIGIGAGRQDDPRVCSVMAVLIWRYLQKRGIAERQSGIPAGEKYTIDDAIEYAERALKYVEEMELRTFVLNNIARLYAQRNGDNDLENALARIQDLQRYLGEKDLPLSVSISSALVMLRRAQRHEKGWITMQSEATLILESANNRPEVTGWDRNLIRRELDRVDKAE